MYMRNNLLPLLLAMMLFAFSPQVMADDFVNLTPRPKSMTTSSGSLILPTSFTIGYSGIDEAMVSEINRFAEQLQSVTGYSITTSADATDALINISAAATSTKEGGYSVIVNKSGVTIKAREVLGMFYALQTIKKILPANVMAGVKDEAVTTYALPFCSIVDEPRFAYRGFMLDVSRHFFTIDEVKRMIDLMSYYKLNNFHWHLSDDQGWRVEIKKYPKLTTIGATAPNSRFTDMNECTQYWINKPYGPYFYTQDELREVVNYAAERHIEVIPEIDMPGHFCAVLAAYPEFSCSPEGSHSVQIDGGIYSDVLNVGNAAAVQFAKDVLGELMEIFPSKYIHIGGDECPTTVWQNNEECKALYQKLGLSSYRGLQSHFIKQLAEYVAEKGRTLAVWNEAITESGADLDMIKNTGAAVYCWTGAEAAVSKAASLDLPSIYTPFGPYYINRRQGSSELDPPGAGSGSDDVKSTYTTTPPTATSYGVQGTFWTEHVSDANYMEWLALPRLIAIAEAGWTPQDRKDFSDFQLRMTADTTLLNYGNYKYCKYYMTGYNKPDGNSSSSDKVMPHVSSNTKHYYYRIVSGGTDSDRKDRCIELLAEGSALISKYASNSAAAGVIWTSAQAAEGDANYDNQWWSLEEDASNPGHYALVCKAAPNGSLHPTPTATSTSGRWKYDNSAKHYSFQLGTGAYGTKGSNYYYSIASDNVTGQYLNSSMPRQGLAVNVYSSPNDGGGGQWEFQPLEDYDADTSSKLTFTPLEEGSTYVFTNAIDGFAATAIVDDGTTTALRHSTDAFAQNAWTVESAVVNADGTQSLTLRNAVTGRYIAAPSAYVDKTGYPVGLTTAANALTLKHVVNYDDFRLLSDFKSLFPLPSGLIYAGSTVSGASYDAARLQGAEWNVKKVRVVTFVCTDEEGNSLGTLYRSIPAEVSEITAELCPTFKNTELTSFSVSNDAVVSAVYKRSAYALTLRCITSKGAILAEEEISVPVGSSYTIAYPAMKHFTLESAQLSEGTTLQPTADATLTAVYSTSAYIGAKGVASTVTTLEDGKSYLLYDASSDASRVGYRRILQSTKKINRSFSADELDPSGVWTLEGSANNFKVKNDYYALYVPALQRSTATTASANGASFTFNLNDDGETWNVKGANGQYWDGIADGSLVGWNQGTGHPIRISTFYAQPYYTVSITCVDAAGTTLQQSETLVAADESYPLVFPTIEGYTLQSVAGNESYNGVVEDFLNLTITYKSEVDAIHAVTLPEDSSVQSGIYDLQGRRLQQVSHPGLYIINGKKTIVK